jgi:hypothetical protein
LGQFGRVASSSVGNFFNFFGNLSSPTGFYKTPQAECYLVGQPMKVAYKNKLCAYLRDELGGNVFV